MKSNLILIISIVVAIAVVGVAFFVLKPTEEVSLPLLVEEYADYNCPHCATFQDTANQLKDEFGDDMDFVFIPHPILGSSALQATFAAEAARNQGEFEAYTELLFENQDARTEEDFVSFATELDLDIEKFNDDRESQELQDMVTDRLEENRAKGINSTPTVYVNGKKVINFDYENLRKLIQEKIELGKSQQNENN